MPPAPESPGATIELLQQAGIALCDSGAPTLRITERLYRLAIAYGIDDVRLFVLPTGVFVGSPGYATAFRRAEGHTLNLDQNAALHELFDVAAAGRCTAADCLRRLHKILRAPSRYGVGTTIFGHALLGVGLGLIITPTVPALGAYAVLSALVGAGSLMIQRTPRFAATFPVVAAFLVTLVANRIAGPWLGETPIMALVPPLAWLLPAAKLTTGALDLSWGDTISGAARLLDAGNRIMLLAFGALAATQLLPPASTIATYPHLTWGPWAAPAVFAVGMALVMSAPIRVLPHMTAICYSAYGAMVAGGILFDPLLSGFFGGLVATVASMVAQRLPKGPPAAAGFLAAFWLLVPGRLGLSEVIETGITHQLSSLTAGGDALLTVVAIATGVLVAAGPARIGRDPHRGSSRPRADPGIECRRHE